MGQQLENFTLTCFDGSEFRLAEQRGKVVFINLWATYCTPCVRELPFFDDLLRTHAGDVAVLAVHSMLATEDPQEFLAGRDYAISFAHDRDNRLTEEVGGSDTLPQTVVLNRRGEVIYNQVGSVTPELLEALYDKANEQREK